MLFALFFLLNLFFALAFLYVIYRAVILVRKDIGIWAAFILVLGILPSSLNSPKNDTQKFTFNTDKVIVKGTSGSKYLILEDNWLNDICLNINYGLDEASQKYIPTEANSLLTGITNDNYKWIPQIVLIKPTENPKRMEYEVYGVIQWKFFFISNYSESKTYKGFIDIK